MVNRLIQQDNPLVQFLGCLFSFRYDQIPVSIGYCNEYISVLIIIYRKLLCVGKLHAIIKFHFLTHNLIICCYIF